MQTDAAPSSTEPFEVRNRWSGKVQFTAQIEAGLSWHLKIGAAIKWAFSGGADLRGAALSGADLRDADLRGADLRDAVLSGADLRGAVLSGVPKIDKIDAKIVAAIQGGGHLDMSAWHRCGTTHCRAGWAITLAGEAGAALELAVGSAVAGALIYAASRPDKPVPDFYAGDDAAMADLEACVAEQGEVA